MNPFRRLMLPILAMGPVVAGMLTGVASPVLALNVSNACTNSVIANATQIEIDYAGTVPVSVEPGASFQLTGISQTLALPGALFVAGYNLGLLVVGSNTIPGTVTTFIEGTNTVEGIQQTPLTPVALQTTITDPDGVPGSGDETATSASVAVTHPNQTWTAGPAGAIGFREDTRLLGVNSGGTVIRAVIGGFLNVQFRCSPGTVTPPDPGVIILVDPAANFASTESGAPPTCQGVAATIVGTALNDVITGTAGSDVIVAGDGNDTVNGGGGNDRVCGDKGRDTINGETGHDTVFGGTGPDTINGGNGNDILRGNPGGGSTADTGDVISGGAGDDILDGWVGNDRLIGGDGDDLLIGAAGIDTVDYRSATTAVTASISAGTATGVGTDTFSAIENLIGSDQNDSLTGDSGSNSIGGGDGSDSVRGSGGVDALTGGTGADDVRGGGGNDSVLGNSGNDHLAGDSGVDTCNGGPGTDSAAVNCETTIGVP